MANTMRWRYGETSPVMIPVDSATVIEIGDLVYLDVDDAKPAASQTDQGSEGGNQQMFHDNFAGVAMQASPSGKSDPIRVATVGVFEFDCLSTTLEVGDLMSSDENGARHRAVEPDGCQGNHRKRGRRALRETAQPGGHARARGRRQQHDEGRHPGGAVRMTNFRMTNECIRNSCFVIRHSNKSKSKITQQPLFEEQSCDLEIS